MIKKEFLERYNGQDVYKYTISGDIIVTVTDIGARILSILAPDKNGKLIDVVLGYKDVDGMLNRSSYMGATVGRCANRIGKEGFELNGKFYPLWHKENKAAIHGGKFGFDKKIFDTQINNDKNLLIMNYKSPDGEEGYPGNLDMVVKFSVIGSKLVIEYGAICDKDTVFNPTNHVYFNINGENDGSILDNVVKLSADAYLPTDSFMVPTGEVKKVSGTPFDFNKEKPIGKDIDADNSDLKTAGGFDHNFCIMHNHFATAYSIKTGIRLDAYTDMPGVQFYSGNNLRGDDTGKSPYPKRSGFCLETQFYPDAIHNPKWKSPILKKGEKFYSKTEYEFSLK